MGILNALRPREATTTRHVLTLITAVALVFGLAGIPKAEAKTDVTLLSSDDFIYGTYVIDKPGVYRLTESISFNPNSAAVLTAAASNPDTAWLADALEWPTPVDGYHAGMPLFTQFYPGGTADFSPGGLLDAQYDPAAYGVGFFAAISISAEDVVLDLNGYTIEQSREHALLQRFFAVIELADQPFMPNQGPSGFGDGIDSAKNVTIRNGTIGRSSHHGIHGNGNANVTVSNIQFDGYEVAALALNGVDGLDVTNVAATNRKDVPVLGTFSSAQFIKGYIEYLDRVDSPTTLNVAGDVLAVGDIKAALSTAINNVYEDIVSDRHQVDGRAVIDSSEHPVEYALFHNAHGVVDGNSYSFLVNNLGVAVNGFPSVPDGEISIPSRNVRFKNVHVRDQQAFINEIIAIDTGAPAGSGTAAIDPVGAVFQVHNLHPVSGEPITISDIDDAQARYVGNPVANAQAFVTKAAANGEFADSTLDTSRLNIPASVIGWVEGEAGSETLANIEARYLCNGDSMFHVNKGVIGFKMDATVNLRLTNTSVNGLANLGDEGSSMCGDYRNGLSHPGATLLGYGGSMARGYSFAGSEDVRAVRATAHGVTANGGSAIGFDVLTDTDNVTLVNVSVDGALAGVVSPTSPTAQPRAIAFRVGADATGIKIVRGCSDAATEFLEDASGSVVVSAACSTRG